MKIRILLLTAAVAVLLFSCAKEEKKMKKDEIPSVKERVAMYAPVNIKVDMSHLLKNQVRLIHKLVEAGEYADRIFWNMSSHDAMAMLQMAERDPKADQYIREYLKINYGPYDRIFGMKRFYGEGPERKPLGAGFYPEDLTREAFNKYLETHPEQAEALKDQYSVVVYNGAELKAIPYHEFFADEIEGLVKALNEAAELAENSSLKAYLKARAKAISTDDYYESDVKWMQLRDNDIDVVIGPIENYEDELFNYKTAYEVAVMIKDPEGTAKLQKYISHLDNLERQLPEKKEYIRKSAGKANVLEVVNIAYFGGDFQAGIKTIAASLPNDPRVHEKYGGKKQMYKNMMEAKFNQILVPIAEKMLAEEDLKYIDGEAFTDFVTLHEVSHTLGRGYVYGKGKELKVRTALKDAYSAIEESKADILSIYATPYMIENGVYSKESAEKRMVTYLAGIFRSVRFGIEEAHGRSNIMQFNFLAEKGAFYRENGKWRVNFEKFHPAVTEFAAKVLNIEAEGDYNTAVKFIEKYGEMPEDLAADMKKLNDIPRDLNTTYEIVKEVKPVAMN